MQRVSSGYTIVEVIIFLAVSAALLTISLTFLSGNEGHNRFSQSMRDMQSKMQDWLNDAPTGFAGGTSGTQNGDVHCVSPGNSNRAKITDTGKPKGDPDCIFLGKAIQFTDSTSPSAGQDSQVYAYPIFGIRAITPSGQETRPVADLIEANPIAAVGIESYSGGKVDLTDVYNIGGGAKVKKIIKSSGVASDNSHLAGFFLSFNQQQTTSSGSSSLKAYQYPIDGNRDPGNNKSGDQEIDECINLNSSGLTNCTKPLATPNDQWPPSLIDWEICFYNDSNSDMAVLTVSSSNGLGVSTKLEFKPC